MASARLTADELVATAAEAAALRALREATKRSDGPMESRGGVYVTDGRLFAEGLLRPCGRQKERPVSAGLLGLLLAGFLRERPRTLPRIFTAG